MWRRVQDALQTSLGLKDEQGLGWWRAGQGHSGFRAARAKVPKWECAEKLEVEQRWASRESRRRGGSVG